MLYQQTRSLGNTIRCQVRGQTLLVTRLSESTGKWVESENNSNKKGSDIKRCNIGLE